jgi:hypothetical protein
VLQVILREATMFVAGDHCCSQTWSCAKEGHGWMERQEEEVE